MLGNTAVVGTVVDVGLVVDTVDVYSPTVRATTVGSRDTYTVTFMLPEVVRRDIHSTTMHKHIVVYIIVPLDTISCMKARTKIVW